MANGPLTVVTPGSNIQNPSLSDLVLDSSIPFTKLDTTTNTSFQTISVLFSNEPAQPPLAAPNYSITEIYQFPHGYNYIPSIWLMWQNSSPEFPPTPADDSLITATTFYPFGDDTSSLAALLSIQEGGPYEAVPTYLATQLYGANNGTLQTTTAILYTMVDNTNVYINVMKFATGLIDGAISPLYLAGVTLDIRCYVFAEPANTSTY